MAIDPTRLPSATERGTATWGLDQLGVRLEARRSRLERYDNYYRGKHNLRYATRKFREAFGDIFASYSENICKLIVDAAKERMHVVGFRMGADRDLAADTDGWRMWQANQMDAWHTVAHRIALTEEQSYIGVWAGSTPETPKMRVLDPRTTIVATASDDPLQRLAALRVWVDEWDGRLLATVYLPGATWKFRSATQTPVPQITALAGRRFAARWEPRVIEGEPWPLPNPLGIVPIVPLTNEPELNGSGESEIKAIIPINDAINFAVANMMLGIEFAVFRQRFIINWEPEIDETTGREKEIDLGIGRLMQVPPPKPGDPESKVGDFAATDITPYVKFVEQRLQMAATISRTPHHYILGGQGTYPSGETLNATEVGLVAKVRDKILFIGEGHEEAIRLAFQVLGDPRGTILDSETLWRDPERRTESQHVDSVLKMGSMGVPNEIQWEELNFTPQQIERIKQLRAEEALSAPIPDLGAPPQLVEVNRGNAA